jgi:hypothetical protein
MDFVLALRLRQYTTARRVGSSSNSTVALSLVCPPPKQQQRGEATGLSEVMLIQQHDLPSEGLLTPVRQIAYKLPTKRLRQDPPERISP